MATRVTDGVRRKRLFSGCRTSFRASRGLRRSRARALLSLTIERDIKKSFWNVLLWAGTRMFTTKGKGPFLSRIWSLKASVGIIAACACLCYFSAPLKSFVDFLSFRLFRSWARERYKKLIVSIYFQFLWISLMFVIEKNITSARKE